MPYLNCLKKRLVLRDVENGMLFRMGHFFYIATERPVKDLVGNPQFKIYLTCLNGKGIGSTLPAADFDQDRDISLYELKKQLPVEKRKKPVYVTQAMADYNRGR